MQQAAVAAPLLRLPLLAVAAMHGAAVARHKAAHHEPAVAAMHGAAVAHGDGPRAGMQGASVTSPRRLPFARSRSDKPRSSSGGDAGDRRLRRRDSVNVTIAHDVLTGECTIKDLV